MHRKTNVNRFLAFLLLCSVLLSAALTGCGTKDPTAGESEVTDASENADSASTSAQNKYEKVENPTYRTNVALHKSYRASKEASVSYPDTYGSELTDGITLQSDLTYMDPCFSCYTEDEQIRIVIDLGEIVSRIYEVELSYYYDAGPGIGIPESVRVHASDDGEHWSVLAHIQTDCADGPGWYQRKAACKTYKSARYIRFTMTRTYPNLMLDELSVYADVAPENTSEDLRAVMDEAYREDSRSYTEALRTVADGVTDTSLPCVPVSVGAAYTLSRSASEQHPDDGKLTDGSPTGGAYETGCYVGFEGGEALDITLNLGKDGVNISRFDVSLYRNDTLGAYLPAFIDVSVLKSGEFVLIGRVYAPLADETYAVYTLSLPVTVSTEQVRFSFPESDGRILLLEELTVSSYTDRKTSSFVSFYRETPIQKTAPSYFPSSAGDYNTRQNLISGLTQRIFSLAPLAAGTIGNSPEDSGQLTDGKLAVKEDFTDPAFFKFGSGEAREVVYDLGAIASVDGYGLSFLRQDNVGINDPFGVLFSLSEDGESWYDISVGVLPSESGTHFLREKYSLDRAYRARYVKFSFMVWPNAYCDELEVFGTKNAASASPLRKSGEDAHPMQNGYAPRDTRTMGANDIVLLCNYANYLETDGYTAEQLLPYVAYLDADGNIKGRMFDGFMFLPSGGGENGGRFYADATFQEVKAYYDKALQNGGDLDVLNSVMEQVNAALHTDDKAVVYIGLAYPGKNVLFGDVDGDGRDETLDTPAKRLAAVEMQINYFLSEFNKKKLKNVTFGGYYWLPESANADKEEAALLCAVADTIHAKGLTFSWIPYFKGPGFDCWRYYGFDIACMQPNYMFLNVCGEEYVFNTAIMTEKLGMCVEMEFMAAVLNDPFYFKRYMTYLTAGKTYGYMTDTVHYYYQEIYGYYDACCSEQPFGRMVYDYTHDFITGTLNTEPDCTPNVTVSVSGNSPAVGTLNLADDSAIMFELVVSPQYGSLSLSSDGSFIYYPYADEAAGDIRNDTFSFRINNYLGTSDPGICTISFS